ncbi:uncharacterized protein LOC110914193 [Helianthus annuus]|uniref:uncharacterized protein LOC110914193 n=1 Tax=Helianthus annuus TaxID=4232 RepID=UPI001652FF5D|nr:uncharacterized protein LOC110914193 [Helianthus annuus]
MQYPQFKRPRIGSSSAEVASSSNASIGASLVTRRQTSHRNTLLRSRAAVAALSNAPTGLVGFPNVGLQSPDYVDMGSCTEVCEYCGALFWFEERLTSFPISGRPRYNRCCRGGKIELQYPSQPLNLLRTLFSDAQFMSNIRAYNAMFCMTSFGAIVDDAINQGGGPYVFKVSGQVSHWLGSLCPSPGDGPRFLQMYIFDSEHEVANRLRFFPGIDSHGPTAETVAAISQMLDDVNPYVRLFRSARELCSRTEIPDFEIRLHSRVRDNRYATPTSHTLGAIVCDNSQLSADFDVIIKSKDNIPHRVSKLHPSYMPLQYPLLFPRAEQGWSPELRLTGTISVLPDDQMSDDRKLTPIMFYGYQMHDRQDVYTHILRASRLLQQYLVDAYVCVEHSRLEYFRANQDEFRCEFLQGVHDAISRGDTEARSIGKRVILPSSFTGGPRYMYKHYQDALAICRVHGNPQYFITFTCNVHWPEITREINRVGAANAQDRPDIIPRVFQMKVRTFVKHLRKRKPFGDVTADLYTIEFQKRGLPHYHTLLWVSNAYSIRNAEQVDHYISAELPDPVLKPVLYRIVTDCMLHGPCGLVRMGSPCMKDGVCKKSFPKPYEDVTRFDNAGYVHYKRSSTCEPFLKNGVPLDNGYVVPYNENLLMHFDAHINVEYCGWTMLIKYLFKYISKGADRIQFALTRDRHGGDNEAADIPEVVDEIKNYTDGRFICPHEAMWRIFSFPIHHRNPPVQVLAVHLEGKQNLTFRQSQRLLDIASNSNTGKTTLTEWFVSNANEISNEGNSALSGVNLRYVDYLSKYRWDTS